MHPLLDSLFRNLLSVVIRGHFYREDLTTKCLLIVTHYFLECYFVNQKIFTFSDGGNFEEEFLAHWEGFRSDSWEHWRNLQVKYFLDLA